MLLLKTSSSNFSSIWITKVDQWRPTPYERKRGTKFEAGKSKKAQRIYISASAHLFGH